MATVKDHFKPEFLNRVDEILVFHRLEPRHLERIVDIQLDGLRSRLHERNIELVVDEAARRHLAGEGYDPAYGARPLKRLIQRSIENELAVALLDGRFTEGDTIEIGLDDSGLTFRKLLPADPVTAATGG